MPEAVLESDTPTTPEGATSATKVCRLCGRDQPIDQFRRRYKDKQGSRHSECRECRRLAKPVRQLQASTRRDRDRRNAQTKREKDLAKYVTELTRKQRDFHAVAAVVQAMTARFGGIDRMVTLWAEAFEKARRNRRASRLVMKSVWAIFDLGTAVHAQAEKLRAKRAPSLDWRTFSDEDLRESLLENAKTIIVKDPRLVIRAAEQLGWTFARPGEEPARESA